MVPMMPDDGVQISTSTVPSLIKHMCAISGKGKNDFLAGGHGRVLGGGDTIREIFFRLRRGGDTYWELRVHKRYKEKESVF